MRVKKTHIHSLLFAILFIASFTFVRKYLILFYPFLIALIIQIFGLKFSKNSIITLSLVTVAILISIVFNGFWLVNNMLGLYIFMPSLVFIMATKGSGEFYDQQLKEKFWSISSGALLLVNFTATCTFVYVHLSHKYISPITSDLLDDAFYGLYGKYGLGGHILSVFNIIYATRYFFVKKYKLAIVFLISSILGFYGLGLLLAILSLFFTLRKRFFRRGSIKVVFITMFLLMLSVIVIRTVNRHNYDYIKNTLMSFVDNTEFDYYEEMDKARSFETTRVPRKITFYNGVYNRILKTPSIILWGTSPGTYNSRAAFLLNGDISRTKILKDNVKKRPPYHQEDVFPLFNTTTTLVPWMGGTRNQPFSSVISIFMEYGFILGILFMFIIYKFWKKVVTLNKETLDYYPLQFIFIYTFFLSFFVYYFDLIEYVLPILLLFKVYELVES